jgi:hypothetical protein
MSASIRTWLFLAGLGIVGAAAFLATGVQAKQDSRVEVNPQLLPPGVFTGLVGLASGQHVRLSVASLLPAPAPGGPPQNGGVALIQLFSEIGELLAQREDEIPAGGSISVDLTFEDLVPPGTAPKRIEIRAAALRSATPPGNLHPPEPCRASLEIYDADTGKTTVFAEGGLLLR